MTDPNATNQAAGGGGEEAVRPDSSSGFENSQAPLATVRLLLIAAMLGLVAARVVKAGPEETRVISLAGAFAVISTLFGGPLPSSLMLFEMVAAKGQVPSAKLGRILLPGLVAAGSGALLFTGVAHWPVVGSLPCPRFQTTRRCASSTSPGACSSPSSAASP